MPASMSSSRKRFLVDKNRTYILDQPRLRLLRRRLLAIGGEEVVLKRSGELEELLARAEVWRRVIPLKVAGEPNQCHKNTARIYLKSPSKHRIVTGWVLHGDDVVWRQHSWLLRKNELCETTFPAKVYYGVILDETEAACFVRAELGGAASSTAPDPPATKRKRST